MPDWANGEPDNIFAVFECYKPRSEDATEAVTTRDVYAPLGASRNQIDGVVFVLNIEGLNKPKRFAVWRPVPSVIGLERFDGGLCPCGHVVHLMPTTMPTTGLELGLVTKIGNSVELSALLPARLQARWSRADRRLWMQSPMNM